MPKHGQSDADAIFAATLYGESDPDNVADACAIAQVVVNRVAWEHKPWGASPAEACLAPWQFSCWNWMTVNRPADATSRRLQNLFREGEIGGPLRANLSPWFRECQRIAALAAARGGGRSGSTHYHASYIKTPKWARGSRPNHITAFQSLKRRRVHGHLFYAIAPNGDTLDGGEMWSCAPGPAPGGVVGWRPLAAAFGAGAVVGLIGGKM